jgi:hypothetical protein
VSVPYLQQEAAHGIVVRSWLVTADARAEAVDLSATFEHVIEDPSAPLERLDIEEFQILDAIAHCHAAEKADVWPAAGVIVQV